MSKKCFDIYGAMTYLADNSTCHASLRCTLWQVFAFYKAIRVSKKLLVKYTKLPITIRDQIEKLKKRELLFRDEKRAAHYLSNISYYRLRAYTYPFQNNDSAGQPFEQKIYFEDIMKLYVFDRKLRLLLYNAIEKIEIALRTQIIYQYAIVHGAFWHLNPTLYNNSVFFASQIASLQKEVNRSNETFIKHYKAKYSDPSEPPSWMSLEVSSIGLLSKIFSNLKDGSSKYPGKLDAML